MGRFFVGMVRREMQRLLRRPFVWALPVTFFLIVALMFSITVTGQTAMQHVMAPGVLWTGAFLAGCLALGGMYRADYDSGFIEQAVISPHPLPLFVVAKTLSHWLMTGLPLTLVAPLVAIILSYPLSALSTLSVLLFVVPLGTLIFSFLASLGAALTVGQGNSMLTALIILPLSIPVLIFATAVLESAMTGLPINAPLSLLAAVGVLSLTILPIATAGVLRAIGGGR